MGGVIIALCLMMHLYTYRNGGIQYLGSSTLWLTIMTMLGLLTLLMGFKQYRSWSESRVGLWLQALGRHTLDIYFIHYFLLPRNLNIIGEWFRDNPNPIIEYVLALTIAVAVIMASLLVGRIIRLSPTLAHWLLGARNIKI